MLDGTGDGDARIGGFTCSDANPILVSDALLGEGWGTMYISVPAYNVPATTNVLATPLIESAKAPGLCQYLNPIVCGPIPPELMQMAINRNLWVNAIVGLIVGLYASIMSYVMGMHTALAVDRCAI